MVDSSSSATAQPPQLARRLLTFLSRPGLIGGAGIFSVLAGGLMGLLWIKAHSTYWEGQVDCSASMGISTFFRHSISVGALLAGIAITITLFRIATRPAPRAKDVVLYWIATVSLWALLANAALAGFGVSVNACLRGISP